MTYLRTFFETLGSDELTGIGCSLSRHPKSKTWLETVSDVDHRLLFGKDSPFSSVFGILRQTLKVRDLAWNVNTSTLSGKDEKRVELHLFKSATTTICVFVCPRALPGFAFN